MYRKKYLFFPDSKEEGCIVGAGDLYTLERGCGFITEKSMERQDFLQLPELNGGFVPAPWYRSQELTVISQESTGCTVRQENREIKDRQIPLRFKCDVPREGSYRIKAVIHAREDMNDIRVFTGRRSLAAYREKLSAGEKWCSEVCVKVCPIIPRGKENAYDNCCIELAVTADIPCLSEIEVEEINCPVLYIAGDSTVTDQPAEYPYAPGASYAGWGQMLPCFIRGELAVSNHAHSGLTTESFRQEGHYQILQEHMKTGDFVFFQFGHNDQKLMHLKAREGYCRNLEKYIAECRDKKAFPVLVTPVARNSWKGSDGSYNDLLAEYADACHEIGNKLNVPVLDLHKLSMEFVTGLQKEGAKKYFFPSDYTHYNDYGARQMAAMICREIKCVCGGKNTGYKWLAEQVEDAPYLWEEPEITEPLQKPEGFEENERENEEYEQPERPYEPLLRAEALDMVIRRAGFFMTNVYNDLFTDVIGHEWYAGVVECGIQNGIVTEQLCGGRKFRPSEPVTLLDFIVFLMLAYAGRRTLPKQQTSPYDDKIPDEMKPYISAACQLGVLAKDGKDRLDENISRGYGAEICRRLKIR